MGSKRARRCVLVALVAVLAVTLGAEGAANAAAGPSISLTMGTAPDSLDPGFGYTTQAAESDWLAYTGLVTYAHSSGIAGTDLIPGLATSLPTITDGGRTYAVTLRRGLVYSNGAPVRASDFRSTVERAIRIPWGGSGAFIVPEIRGALAYATNRAATISGISADNKTGRIVIHLVAADGAFDYVLAFPSLALVPASAPFRNDPTRPPPGVGPYELANVRPNASFSLVQNPHWAAIAIPGIPAGSVDVDVKIDPDVNAGATSVLDNTTDVFDWADTLPPRLVPTITSGAGSRYSQRLANSVYYFFLNTHRKPFSSRLAREAVVTALDETAFNQASGGTLEPGCYFVPPVMVGHPSSPCPYGNPAAGGNVAEAQSLVRRSGTRGTRVTVWGEAMAPRRQWVDLYARLLRQIGFRVSERIVPDVAYFSTIGTIRNHAQTGFADWNADYPDPSDFYELLDGRTIARTNNANFGLVNDRHIEGALTSLGRLPATGLSAAAGRWSALGRYVAREAYVAVFGYQTFPTFTSDRINQSPLVFSPVYGWDWSSFSLS